MTSYPLKGGTFQLCVRIIRPDVGSTPLKRQKFHPLRRGPKKLHAWKVRENENGW
jgi:hypothetical protein